VGFPCVIKARFSNFMVGGEFVADPGAAYATTAADVEAAALERKQGGYWPIVQGFVEGKGAGVFALCDRGRAVAWFAHERLRDVRPTGSGSSLRRSVTLSERLRAPAERLLEALRWHGPAMVEFRDDGAHAPVLMEVNGRFWGSLQLAIAAGVDFPLMWMRVLEGGAPEVGAPEVGAPEVIAPYRVGVTVRWLWGDVKRLLHILRGRPAGYPGPFPTLWQGLAELFGPQPRGTRLEVWDRADPWPALGEWVEGLRDIVASRRAGARVAPSTVTPARVPTVEGVA
jgi:hypothetical protein